MENVLDRHQKSKKTKEAVEHGIDRIYVVKMPKDEDVYAAVREYKNDPNVEYAEPVRRCNSSLC